MDSGLVGFALSVFSVRATEGDTKQALAFCLATFFRQIGFTGGKNSALLETCPSFIYRDKDKKILKYKLKKVSKPVFFVADLTL